MVGERIVKVPQGLTLPAGWEPIVEVVDGSTDSERAVCKNFDATGVVTVVPLAVGHSAVGYNSPVN